MEEENIKIKTGSSEEEESDEESDGISSIGSTSSRKVYLQFFIFSIGILCSISSYSGLIDLQSSINISGALGNKSLMMMSISTVFCCLFVTPFIIQVFGAKNTIHISQISYIIYVASNFFPVSYVLLPGGIFLGVAEGLLYTPALMYCTYFGRELTVINGLKKSVNINKFVGYFWAIFQMNEIFGNSLSAVILTIGKDNFKNAVSSNTSYHNATTTVLLRNNFTDSYRTMYYNLDAVDLNFTHNTTNWTTSLPYKTANTNFSICGADDCYVEKEFEAIHSNYVPLSHAAVHTMLGVYTFLAVVAIPLMHQTPSLPRKFRRDSKIHTEKRNLKFVWTYIKLINKHIKKTFQQLVHPQQVLITPLTIYHGLYVSFISSEINRAFVSCTIGVEKVGMGMALGGSLNVLVSFLYARVSGNKALRAIFLMSSFIMDMSLYIFCLVWKPTAETAYIGLAVAIAFGFSDGVWSPYIDEKYAKYFSKNEEVAYSINNLWNCVGFTMTYGLTTFLCVRQKLFIQITGLFLGAIGLMWAEIYHKKEGTIQ